MSQKQGDRWMFLRFQVAAERGQEDWFVEYKKK